MYEIVRTLQRSHHNPGCLKPLQCWTELFQNSFLTFTDSEWNKLNPDIRNVDSYSLFRKTILSFKKSLANCICGIYDSLRIKLLNRSSLFSDIYENISSERSSRYYELVMSMFSGNQTAELVLVSLKLFNILVSSKT